MYKSLKQQTISKGQKAVQQVMYGILGLICEWKRCAEILNRNRRTDYSVLMIIIIFISPAQPAVFIIIIIIISYQLSCYHD
jgi:hypothetical protein